MMTDNDITKALECCGKNTPICIECSYKGKCNRKDCYDYLKSDALDLINRQKAEIERLCMELDEVIIAKDLLFDEAEALIKKAKADAIKEFAERVKEKQSDVCAGHGLREYVVSVYDIDTLVKEMVGEG